MFASALVGSLLATSAPVQAIEEPAYTVLQQSEAFELRQVAPYMLAEVRIDGPREQADREAFRVLFGYISGRNRGERKIEMTAPVTSRSAPAKIEMTAPVTSRADAGGWITGFVLPARFTPDNAPQPEDPRVQLRAVPAQQLAVRRFSGRWSEERVAGELQALREALTQAGWRVVSEPVLSRFDPPMLPPFLRRNEVWLEVAR